jgi:hypothetical protein
VIRYPSYKLVFSVRLPLVVIVKHMAFADDCKVREEAALEQVRYYSDFVDLLNHFWQI